MSAPIVRPAYAPGRSWPQARPCTRCGETDRCSVSPDAPDASVGICRTPSAWLDTDPVRVSRSGEEYALIFLRVSQEGQTQEGQVEPEPEFSIPVGSPDLLDRVYSALRVQAPLAIDDVQALLARGFKLEEARQRGYWGHPRDPDARSSVALQLRKALGLSLDESSSVPGLWHVHGCSDLVLAGPGGLGIPVRDRRGRIVAARVRAQTETGGKVYLYLSAPSLAAQKAFRGEVFGAGVVSAVHHALRADGRTWESFDPERDELWITEGELKADYLAARKGVFALAVPGVESWPKAVEAVREILEEMPETRRANPLRVVLAFDADARTNPQVAACLRRLAGALVSLGPARIVLAVALWPVTERETSKAGRVRVEYTPKGVDDAIKAGSVIDTRESTEALEALSALCESAGTRPDPVSAARLALASILGRVGAEPGLAFAAETLDHAIALRREAPGEYSELRKRFGALVGVRDWSNAVRDRAKGSTREKKLSARNANPTQLPRVEVTEDEERCVSEALAAMAKRYTDSGTGLNLYSRGPVLVRVLRSPVTSPGIERPGSSVTIGVVPPATLREHLSASVFFWQRRTHPDTGAELPSRVPVPVWAPAALRDRGEWPALRRLHGVVEAPVLRPDGSVLSEPGYDLATGLVFEQDPGAGPIRVPDRPTQEDARESAKRLLALVEEFPFKSEAHRAAWVALLLTPFARYAFAGDTPMGVIDGNTPGSGKSRLVDLISCIFTGRTCPRMAPSDSDEETRKRITSIALAGDPMVLLDNVPSTMPLGGAAIDSALTCGGLWSDRILGASEKKTIPLFALWFATGNNVQIRGDLARRVVHLRLESSDERPDRRQGFKIPNLLRYAQEHRGELAADALTILRAWVLAGRPQPGIRPWGSFEGWAETVCAACVWAGLADPGQTGDTFREEADTTTNTSGMLLRGLLPIARKTGNRFTALQVLEELDRDAERARSMGGPSATSSTYEELREALGELGLPQSRSERSASLRVGKVFQALKTRIIGGLKIVPWVSSTGKSHTKVGNFWKLESASVNPNGDNGGDGDGGPRYPVYEKSILENHISYRAVAGTTLTIPTIVTSGPDDPPDDLPDDPPRAVPFRPYDDAEDLRDSREDSQENHESCGEEMPS